MKGKPFFLVLFVLCFIVSFSVPGAGADKKSALTVKKIAFTGDENGGEWVTFPGINPAHRSDPDLRGKIRGWSWICRGFL